MVYRILFVIFLLANQFVVRANHIMGGEITWRCSGNGYVFQLVVYRDCNGADVNPISENLQVWNHPSVSSIAMPFLSRTDVSPFCTPVVGSPSPISCGTGANGGSALGATEKIVYESAPIVLAGIPPSTTGWIFTYDDFSRSSQITNLINPSTVGITVSATMFAIPNGVSGVCGDNSPSYLQNAYLVSCTGEEYAYNAHAVDVDLDSIRSFFGAPLNDFTGVFNPPTNPSPIAFQAGFSASNPTPDASFQAGNIASQLNPETGHFTFTSNTAGSFVVKIITNSYRNGNLIASVERDVQLIVTNCVGNNTSPDIAGPFGGLFETTVIAGALVNFTLQSTDVEMLQDGSPQSNFMSVSSNQYGTNFTSTTGCNNGPCATLNQSPVISGSQGVSTQFSWQTACNHLVDASGNELAEVPYVFVFRIRDDYCPIPRVRFSTVVIRVQNPGIIEAPEINCISTASNGDVIVQWDPIVDVNGTFVQQQLFTLETGLVGTYPAGTTSAIIPNPGTDLSFYITVESGCNVIQSSDTVKNVFLSLFNPANGTALLSWNSPSTSPLPGMSSSVSIIREYPAGTFTTIGTVPFGTTNYVDTIDVCSAFIQYQVVYTTPTCSFNSNSVGAILSDMLTPDIPIITSVSADTTSGFNTLTWNQNNQPDTYGYVIYFEDANGFIVEIDTVYGIGNTSFIDSTPITGAVTYSVAAFDSCSTAATPPTFQTSGKANIHRSTYLTQIVNTCTNSVELSWTTYQGWGTDLEDYSVFVLENGTWSLFLTTTDLKATLALIPLTNYCIAIRANKTDGTSAFSNKVCFSLTAATPPETHYLRVATVENLEVILRHEITPGTNVTSIILQRLNILSGQFEDINQQPVTVATSLSFVDSDVNVNQLSYTYRCIVVDSCGKRGAISNSAKTVLLRAKTDQTKLINFVEWSAYSKFDGSVLNYQLYRGIDGIFDPFPIAILDPDERFFEDDVSAFDQSTGKICYYVIAQEALNQYGFQEGAASNQVCPVITPLVFIPNAFSPEGLNPIFKPVVSFDDISKYEFSVLDRWGQLIYQTQDVNEGWDGIHQSSNKLVPLGVYTYVVRVVDGDNQEYYFRGTVTAVRSTTDN